VIVAMVVIAILGVSFFMAVSIINELQKMRRRLHVRHQQHKKADGDSNPRPAGCKPETARSGELVTRVVLPAQRPFLGDR
jgi:hypothetical protein